MSSLRFFYLVSKVSITSEIGPYQTIIYVVKYDVGKIFHRMIIKFIVPDLFIFGSNSPRQPFVLQEKGNAMVQSKKCAMVQSKRHLCLIEETQTS